MSSLAFQSRPVLSAWPEPEVDADSQDLLHEASHCLGAAIDAKDPHTLRHSEEVAELGLLIAETLDLDARAVRVLHIAAHLHDVGKIGIPTPILRKPGPLDAAETARLREHPALGAALVRSILAMPDSEAVAEAILTHHERLDGSGYPGGLRGQAIPLAARVIAVADSLSAMAADRPYRLGRPFEAALAEIIACSGTLYDPDVVSALSRRAAQAQAILAAGRAGPRPAGHL